MERSSFADRLLASVESLPTMSPVAIQVLNMVSDPQTSPAKLSETIGRDAGLTSQILQLSNSAYFGLSRQVTQLQQAVLILGFNEIRNMVVVAATFDILKHNVEEDILKDLWEHYLAVAICARFLAQRYYKEASEMAYVAGLLHDVGKVPFAYRFPTEYRQMMDHAGHQPARLNVMEQDYFDTDHQELGARLLEKWNLPETIVNVAGRHHDVDDEIAQEQPLVPLILLSDALAYAVRFRGAGAELLDVEFRRFLGEVPWREWVGELNEIIASELEVLANHG